MKSIHQTLIPTVVDLNINVPVGRPARIPRTDGGRPGERVAAVDPWGPEWNVHTRVSGVFFPLIPRIFPSPHGGSGAVDRLSQQQAAAAQSVYLGELLLTSDENASSYAITVYSWCAREVHLTATTDVAHGLC